MGSRWNYADNFGAVGEGGCLDGLRVFRRAALTPAASVFFVSSRKAVQLLVISRLAPLPREERRPFWTRCTNSLRSIGCHVKFRGTL